MPVIISETVNGKPSAVSSVEPGRDDAPWLNILTDRERAEMRAFAAVIFPDRQITRRLRRHAICTPTGHKFAAFLTIEECWLYAQALELAPVGLACGERVIALNPLALSSPPSDPHQMGLFDTEANTAS